jgi:predicted N-acetyltransferase YhbS
MPQQMNIHFTYLADCPAIINLLATWFHREWGSRNPMLTVDSIKHSLEERLNRDSLPLTFVAFLGKEPIGSASLKINEMEIYPQYLHWLGAVYVLPEYRNQRVGTQTIAHSISEARRLGVSELYLYTREHETLYAKFGWQPLERSFYHGREVVVMKRTINDMVDRS